MAVNEADDPIMISALQHYVYCPRQCALIHLEQTFEENLYTLRGRHVHERADTPEHESMDGVRIERALPLYSDRLGLIGIADVVEFDAHNTPYPVEYKAGARQQREADEVQLCAQAMCLEDMLNTTVPEGALYYDRSRRRRIVPFTNNLRQQVITTIEAIRKLFNEARLPAPVADKRCPNCSLIDACMPHALRDFAQVVRKQNVFALKEQV